MCQRYALPGQLEVEREFHPARSWWKFTAKYNVAAACYVPAIRVHARESEGVMMRWGLIPPAAEGKPTTQPMALVHSDRIDRSDVYRAPWLNSQRCILPMAGFYVWQLTPENYRQPFFVRIAERAVFGVAAIWDRSVNEDDDDVIESCSMVSVPANGLMTSISHAQRGMPAILRRRDYRTWLKGTPVEARAVLHTYSPDWMQAHPVSPRINSLSAEDAALSRPSAMNG